MTDDIAEVAKGLTKAQLETVLRGYWGDSGRGYWPLRNALAKKGLLPLDNALATAVRSYLKSKGV